ncbi:MBL fold hydrolase [Alphaproteobacteria bacterium]|nr:MBL fold hydrolase [Alphaproteobacteria bacterium]
MKFDPQELIFIPLGGTGEIGMNLSLYGLAGKWLAVDMGVSFADDAMPGIDVFMPDPGFLEQRQGELLGIVITHAHEDHLGAVAYLWPRLRCPIYASPFAAGLLRFKLAEAGLEREAPVTVISGNKTFSAGPFGLEFVPMAHSIPEANALAIHTCLGTIIHSGDWKFDPKPLVGPPSDKARLAQLGQDGVLAVVGDSTNVLTEGISGSEAEVGDSLVELFGGFKQRIAVACFASNVARLSSIARAAAHHDRYAVLCGRSLRRIDQIAREVGYLKEVAPFLTEEEGALLPPSKTVYICTGSQGEPRAALMRIAMGTHPRISLDPGDAAVFSSRIIPGRERSIYRLQNILVRRGVEIVTEKDHFVHVSGHPGRNDMREFYNLTKPAILIPVHGEERHLRAHAILARECGIENTPILTDGSVLKLAPGTAEIIGEIPTGRLALDGINLVPLESERLKERQRMLWNGSAVVTVALDQTGSFLCDPLVSAAGLLDGGEEAPGREDVVWAVREAIEEMPLFARQNDDLVREAAYNAVRRQLRKAYGKKPVTNVHLVRR